MHENETKHQNLFLHKTLTAIFLPIIMIIWTIGWTLTNIGSPVVSVKSSQKVLTRHTGASVVEEIE